MQLDYSAGVFPVTRVDREVDRLSTSFRPSNTIEQGAYKGYDSEAMDGLPVGVQVVGQRLEEEKVMEGMKVIQKLMRVDGLEYALFDADE